MKNGRRNLAFSTTQFFYQIIDHLVAVDPDCFSARFVDAVDLPVLRGGWKLSGAFYFTETRAVQQDQAIGRIATPDPLHLARLAASLFDLLDKIILDGTLADVIGHEDRLCQLNQN